MHRKHGLLTQPRAITAIAFAIPCRLLNWWSWDWLGQHVMENIPYILSHFLKICVTYCHKHPTLKTFSKRQRFESSPSWRKSEARLKAPSCTGRPHPTPEMLRSGHQMLLSGPMEWTGMEVKRRKSLQIHLKFVRSSQARATTLVTALWKLKCHHFSSPKLRICEVETKWRIRLHTLCIHISDLQSAPKDGIKRAG